MADVIIGATLTADDQISPKVKSIKQQLKEAQTEVITLSEKFGATSKEAALAAEKAAKLKDAIGDARTLVDAFNPDTKFKAFGAAINTVTGGFSALTGAMALLGVESEDVQKTLVKVQSALAISQGVAQLQEGIQSFGNLKSVLINTLGKSGAVGIAVAGVGLLTAYVTGLFDSNNKLAESEKELAKGFVTAKKEMAALANTIEQAKKGIISKDEALKSYNQSLGKVTGQTNDLQTAEKLMVENSDKYVQVQGLKAQANFLLQQSAEKSAQAELMRMKLAEEDLPRFLRNNLEKQIQSDLDGLKVYDNAVKDINDRISKVKFSVTTSGLGSAFGKGDSKSKSEKVAAKKDEVKELSEYEKIIRRAELDQANKDQQAMMDKHLRSRELITDQNAFEVKSAVDLHTNLDQLEQARTHNEAINAEARIKLSELETAQKLQAAQAVGNALGALADLVGKQTAAGKVLGIAQATINTWIGATEVLRAKSVLPEPFGTIAKIANVAAIVATGINSVKNILKVKVPGGAGGGSVGSIGSVTAPLQAQLPQATNTRLDNAQLNQIGNATARAFVVESDITNNQERIRRLNRAARLG